MVQVPSITLPTTITATMTEEDDDNEPVILWGLTLRITQQLIELASNQIQHDARVITYNDPINGNIKSRL